MRMDMNVKIATSMGSNAFDIYEIYKLGIGVNNSINKVGSYVNNTLIMSNVSFYVSRKNLQGVLLRAGDRVHYATSFTPSDFTRENRYSDTFGKFHFQLFKVLENIHHFHYNVTFAKAWFGTSINGTEGGIARLLHENRIDISSAGGILRHGDTERITFYDYLMPNFPFRTCFIFKNPGSVKPGVEVLRPFSTSTWYSTCAAAFVMCSAIKFAYWIEHRYLRANVNYSYFTSIVITISVFAQQGSSMFPHRLGGRLIYFSLLILSTLLYNYYSSSLVSSLLNSKPWIPTTLKELYETKLKMGTEDQPYTTVFVTQERNNTYVQKINSTRFYENDRVNFMKPKEGVALVKEGGFAYHSEVKTVYPLIAMTFDPDSICDLVEINFVTPGVVGLMAPKKSQYTELFRISLQAMSQRGLRQRALNMWIAAKPECMLNLRALPIGVNELFLVYMIWLAGVLMALLLFLCELLWYKYHETPNLLRI